MKNMKKLFFLMLAVCSFALMSCNGEEENIDPAKFSPTELKFTATDETQTITLLNYDKVVIMEKGEIVLDTQKASGIDSRYANDWLTATVFTENPKEISITVAENTTGKPRDFKLTVYTHNVDKDAKTGAEKPHSGQTSKITIHQAAK